MFIFQSVENLSYFFKKKIYGQTFKGKQRTNGQGSVCCWVQKYGVMVPFDKFFKKNICYGDYNDESLVKVHHDII